MVLKLIYCKEKKASSEFLFPLDLEKWEAPFFEKIVDDWLFYKLKKLLVYFLKLSLVAKDQVPPLRIPTGRTGFESLQNPKWHSSYDEMTFYMRNYEIQTD